MAGFYIQITILLKPQVKDPTVSTAVKSFNNFHASLMKAVTPIEKQESLTLRHF